MKKYIFLLLLIPALSYSQPYEWTLSNDTITTPHCLSSYFPFTWYGKDSLINLTYLTGGYVEVTLIGTTDFTVGFDSAMTTANTYLDWTYGYVFWHQYKLGSVSDIWIKSTDGSLLYLNGTIKQW